MATFILDFISMYVCFFSQVKIVDSKFQSLYGTTECNQACYLAPIKNTKGYFQMIIIFSWEKNSLSSREKKTLSWEFNCTMEMYLRDTFYTLMPWLHNSCHQPTTKQVFMDGSVFRKLNKENIEPIFRRIP